MHMQISTRDYYLRVLLKWGCFIAGWAAVDLVIYYILLYRSHCMASRDGFGFIHAWDK